MEYGTKFKAFFCCFKKGNALNMTLCSNVLKTAHGNIAKVKDKASGFENFIVKLKDKA